MHSPQPSDVYDASRQHPTVFVWVYKLYCFCKSMGCGENYSHITTPKPQWLKITRNDKTFGAPTHTHIYTLYICVQIHTQNYMHTITHRQLNEQPQLAIDAKSFYGRDIRRANCTCAEPTVQSRHFFGVATLKTYIFGALLNSLHSGFAFVVANLNIIWKD